MSIISESGQLQKSIYLIGPHSTGKTTLAKALLEHYGKSTPVLCEIARKVLKKKGYSAGTISSDRCFQMQRDIFEAQFEAEADFFSKKQYFISDRNAVDPIVYTKMYSSHPNDWSILCKTEEWKVSAERYRNQKKSVIVLLQPHQPFLENDGTRKMPADRDEWVKFGKMFSDFLEEQNIPNYTLGEGCANIDDRVEMVLSWAEV